jgi:hypothetical protein
MGSLSMWKFRAILFVVILAVAPSSAVSHAQDLDDAVVVNVPFVFSDGLQNFDAGRYTIRMGEQRILAIRGESNSGFAMAWFEEYGQPSKTTKVVFRKYGHRYVLSEVWIAGETSHTYCLPSKAEEREMAANKAVPAVVVVAALEMPR